MKECPKCKELLGDNVKKCFNCNYDFIRGRVITSEENRQTRIQEEEILNQKIQLVEQLQITKELQLNKNPVFEYKTECINDNPDGTVNQNTIQHFLSEYAQQGWRLHSALSNEVGKNSSGVLIGYLGLSLNATINQTLLIFERCIKPES